MKNQNDKTSAPGGYVHPATIAYEKVGIPMQRSAGNQIQQEMVASEIASEIRQDEAYARVDQYTLEIIQQIFPTPNKGLEFAASILRYAQVMQNVLPGLEDLGEHVAVINVRTLRMLAKLINWGYDTTHKYVTTFCALGLLRKVKQGIERLLVFPLERYVLPINLQPLDNLIAKSRPKVQQFARQVKIRLLQLNPVVLSQASGTELGTFEGQRVSSRDTIYQSLFGLMESEGIDSATSRHISKRIITEVLSQFDTSMLTIQMPDKTYEQAATGTFSGRRTLPAFTPQAEIPYQSTGQQTRPDSYRPQSTRYHSESTGYPTKYPRYQSEYLQYQPESTGYQTKYPEYRAESTDSRQKSTDHSTKYPQHPTESTPEASQGRLSGTKVSARGRLTGRAVSLAPIVEETQTDRGRYAASKVSASPSQEHTQTAGSPEMQPYTLQEIYSHIMTTWDILTSYGYILRENLIDWEADGLSTHFIEQVYEEVYTVNTEYKKRGMAVASRSFFLSVLEKRAIARLADEYQLNFARVYNLILFRTNRERFMIAEQQPQQPAPVEEPQSPVHNQRSRHPEQYQADYSHDDHQPEYREAPAARNARVNQYQEPVDPHVNQYQPSVDSYADEYQPPVDPHVSEYQDQVDPHMSEYQAPVDLSIGEYQAPGLPGQSESTHQQPPVDSRRKKYRHPVDPQVDPSAQESTWVAEAKAGVEEPKAQESAPQQVPIAEIIDRAALQDGLTRLRIPRALNKQNYTSDFLDVYVTYNIFNLFKKIYTDVTLRNDGKMFFAEIFDTARAGAAKNWYNKLFTKCSSPESLLAAFIETIIDLHSRGNITIQNPGGLFNKKIAECEKGISDNVHEHIKVYGELTYEDFVLEIARLASRESLGIR